MRTSLVTSISPHWHPSLYFWHYYCCAKYKLLIGRVLIGRGYHVNLMLASDWARRTSLIVFLAFSLLLSNYKTIVQCNHHSPFLRMTDIITNGAFPSVSFMEVKITFFSLILSRTELTKNDHWKKNIVIDKISLMKCSNQKPFLSSMILIQLMLLLGVTRWWIGCTMMHW